jgi:hypothetical protein
MRLSPSRPLCHLAVLLSAFALSLLLLFGLVYTFLPSLAFNFGAICVVLFESSFLVALLCYEGRARPLEVLQPRFVRPLALPGMDPEDVWVEVEATTLPSGTTAIAMSMFLLLDGSLVGREVSAIAAGESIAEALARVAVIMQIDGLRCIYILTGDPTGAGPSCPPETVRALVGEGIIQIASTRS